MVNILCWNKYGLSYNILHILSLTMVVRFTTPTPLRKKTRERERGVNSTCYWIFCFLLFFVFLFFTFVWCGISQVAEYLVPNIRSVPANGSTKPTYIRFLTGIKAYWQIFSVKKWKNLPPLFSPLIKNIYTENLFLFSFFQEYIPKFVSCEYENFVCWSPNSYPFYLPCYTEICFWCQKKQICAWRLKRSRV